MSNNVRIALILVQFVFITACGAAWPPESPRSEPLKDFGGRLKSEEIGYIYESAEAQAAAGGSSKGSSNWGFVYHEGDFTLGFNPFDGSSAQPGYYDSQVEVVYFDDKIAQLRLDPDKGDKLLLINDMFNQVPSIVVSGARLRVGRTVYELRDDGWWVDGKLVHAFSKK
ncbi:MAG: hypothetical protein R3E77_02425 [Steroidobacteraceae bacterium]